MSQANSAIKFYLTGPNEGKDINLGGFHFEKGVLTIQNPAEAQSVGNIVTQFYSCVSEGDFFAQKEQERADAEKAAAKTRAAAEKAAKNQPPSPPAQ